jgi:hypothetical protein
MKEKEITFDSKEEEYYTQWLIELAEQGYIKEFHIQPEPYEIFPTVKLEFDGKEKSVMRGMTYTADFKIIWHKKAKDIFFFNEDTKISSFTKELKSRHFAQYSEECEAYVSIVDVKGTFASRHNSTLIKFPLIQKIMYHTKGIYINKIMPLHKVKGLFANTFTPKKYTLTDTGKIRKINWEVRTLEDYISK